MVLMTRASREPGVLFNSVFSWLTLLTAICKGTTAERLREWIRAVGKEKQELGHSWESNRCAEPKYDSDIGNKVPIFFKKKKEKFCENPPKCASLMEVNKAQGIRTKKRFFSSAPTDSVTRQAVIRTKPLNQIHCHSYTDQAKLSCSSQTLQESAMTKYKSSESLSPFLTVRGGRCSAFIFWGTAHSILSLVSQLFLQPLSEHYSHFSLLTCLQIGDSKAKHKQDV